MLHNPLGQNLTDTEIELSKIASRILSRHMNSDMKLTVQTMEEHDQEEFVITPIMQELLLQGLTLMSQGKPFSLMPIAQELTTQQAADFLNVSRPYLIKNILDVGEIPFRKVGAHRKILFSDLQTYKKAQEVEQEKLLAELAALQQEMEK